MDPIKLIQKYYKVDSKAYNILIGHSEAVAKKAIQIAKKVPELKPKIKFIYEAAMLHDIGIISTNAHDFGCFGEKFYICHGYLGRNILEKEGLAKHALVCERHLGTGITLKDIEDEELPLPKRDMIPISIEEEIICFADKFFRKDSDSLDEELSIDEVRADLSMYGQENVDKFDAWIIKFKYKQ